MEYANDGPFGKVILLAMAVVDGRVKWGAIELAKLEITILKSQRKGSRGRTDVQS